MTSENEIHNYCPLKENTVPTNEKLGKLYVFVLFLSIVFGVEVIVSGILVYNLSKEISKAQEVARLGEYPLHCLHQLVDPGYQKNASLSSGEHTGCEVWIAELDNSVHKQILSDIRNGLYLELNANNVTLLHSNKPAIHMGAEQELRQPTRWVKNGGTENMMGTTEILNWDNINGPAIQQGMMGYVDGEIVIPREGLYFVYSQVYFQILSSEQERESQQFGQHLYRRRGSSLKPVLLSRATVTKCWHSGHHFALFSSHQGALFHLQQGDTLSLRVLDIQSVRLQEDTTFFGAFKIN
uniref:CD40 ligand-like n=1 Tax=Paramormyrops kingsleyae TaxID=1676925 RepID=A0A3B3RGF4_9TELE|nr:CD40 ligand-like [Paramormyrops kingsleyae]